MAMTLKKPVEALSLVSRSNGRVGLKSLVPEKPTPFEFITPLDIVSFVPTFTVDVPNNAHEAISFYKTVFGFEVFRPAPKNPPFITELRLNGFQMHIFIHESPELDVIDEDDDYSRRDFYVDSYAEVKAIFNKAVAAGAKVLDGITKCQVDIYTHDIWMARVKDPYCFTWTIQTRAQKKGYFANLWDALLYKYEPKSKAEHV
ncbi:hypothetical protein FNV43_RR08939 [Rhamnella rubrinervis]|uniref:Glyoxalase/fosfomycin resistance/dioxygenase domain-containing protein n=1 Tax=Rhamnella rubrinervis TaxID=2594499 RepID=A0A8K0H9I0_9ROSA|nr:hypothetical protein FNV43_RR08939 [Rhamnella rubrinervis]